MNYIINNAFLLLNNILYLFMQEKKKCKTMTNIVNDHSKSLQNVNKLIPISPPMLSINSSYDSKTSYNSKSRRQNNNDPSSRKDLWERLFYQGYKADVCINTNSGVVYAHSNIIVSSFILFH